METKQNWFKQLLMTKPMLAILILLIAVGGLIYWIYSLGKNKGLNTPPNDAPSPEYQPPTAQEK